MKYKARKFECQVCGRIQWISTNHEGESIEYCGRTGSHISGDKAGCSWKPSFGDGFMFNGHTYRKFKFYKK